MSRRHHDARRPAGLFRSCRVLPGSVLPGWFLLGLTSCSSIEPPLPEAKLSGREAFITRRAERVRGIPFPADVVLVKQERDVFREEMQGDAAEDDSDPNEDPVETVLKAFGLMETSDDAESKLEDLLGEAIQGLYDPKKRRLVVVLDDDDRSKESTFSHEVVHAIDDGQFDLEVLLDIGDDVELDSWLARRALVEGSATLHQLDYMMLRSGFDTSASGPVMSLWNRYQDVMRGQAAGLVAGTGVARDDAVRKAPAVLIDLIIMPYVAGARMLNHAKERGGEAGVDAVFSDPPRSTEQVLHPERYLTDRDDPHQIVFPALEEYLPANAVLHRGTLGDYLIRVLLRDDEGELWPFNPFSDTGWEGDRFAVVRGDTSSDEAPAVLWRTEWDSPRDASHFGSRLQVVLAARAAAAAQESASQQSASQQSAPGPSPDRAVEPYVIEVDGTSVRVVIGRDRVNAEAALHFLAAATVTDPDAPEEGGFLAALGWVAGLVARGVDLHDGSTRYELLRGLVGSFESRPGGFDLKAVFGGALHLESTPDRVLAGTAFDMVNFRRNARNGTGSVTLAGLLDPSWSDDALHVDALLGIVYARSSWSVDSHALAYGIAPGIGFGYDRTEEVEIDESGAATSGPTRYATVNLALQAIRYDYAVSPENEQEGSRFRLLWGVLFGRRATPNHQEWWTPLIGYERRGDVGYATLFWGLLELK